jgi:hypothetical protein
MDCSESSSCWTIFLQNVELVTRIWGVFTSIGKCLHWLASYSFLLLSFHYEMGNLSTCCGCGMIQCTHTHIFSLFSPRNCWREEKTQLRQTKERDQLRIGLVAKRLGPFFLSCCVSFGCSFFFKNPSALKIDTKAS